MKNFYQQVYDVVCLIPRGKVCTYGQIAKILGNKNLARQVGWALHKNPNPLQIPCHRVVNRFGMPACGYAFGGKIAQKEKLKTEGVAFLNDEKVDLKKCLCQDFEITKK